MTFTLAQNPTDVTDVVIIQSNTVSNETHTSMPASQQALEFTYENGISADTDSIDQEVSPFYKEALAYVQPMYDKVNMLTVALENSKDNARILSDLQNQPALIRLIKVLHELNLCNQAIEKGQNDDFNTAEVIADRGLDYVRIYAKDINDTYKRDSTHFETPHDFWLAFSGDLAYDVEELFYNVMLESQAYCKTNKVP